MKKYNLFFAIALLTLSLIASGNENKNIKKVIFDTSIHCNNCSDKLFNSLPKESGVIDLKVNIKDKEVTVVFDSQKITVDKLAEMINKLGYSAYIKNISPYVEKE